LFDRLPQKSVTHGQCDVKPTVAFPAADRHRPLTGTKLYGLVTGSQGCKQTSQSRYTAVPRPGVKPATPWSQARRPSRCATTPPHSE